MEEAKPIVPTPETQEGNKDGKQDEVLAVLNEVLKRDFKSREEAVKSVDSLHRMVGDNAIAELREKAKEADNFSKVIGAYAKDQGVTTEEARKTLLEAAMDQTPVHKMEDKPADPNKASITEQRLELALLKLQEKELLEVYPGAKAVLSDLKALRAVQPDKELKEIYEASSLKDMVAKAMTYEQEKATKEASAVEPKSRQVDMKSEAMKQLIEKANVGFLDDKAALVQAFFDQNKK